MNRIAPSCLLLLVIGCVTGAALAGGDYYKAPPQFHFTPDPNAPRNEVGRLGPIGLAIELRQPAFTMYIKSVEPGSPAAGTGKLKPGQIIASINGEVLKDIDPRVQLGNLITKIEASDGTVRLMMKDDPNAQAYPVEFKIPALGAYSETWPVNCKKSDAIVRNMSAFLRKEENWGWGAALFLLSTGEEEDLAEVGRRFSKLGTDNPGFPWSIGYTGPAICEYYLRTGDKSVLPAIQAKCDYLKSTIYNGSWMGRGGANYNYMAGGHLNAAGVHCTTFMMLAKECGVDVDQRTMLEAMTHIYRFAGRGNVAYGDHLPEGGMVDNGKVGKLAFAMAAAANLSPDGENSIYAKARDISATKGFYSTSWLFHGHTGGGIGELWRGAAMGLVKEKRPTQYRSFMNERRWMYELARTHSGGFGWAAGTNVNYTGVNIGRPGGNYIPLIYTLPRKQLRIFGAPPTKYSKTYELPKRPWGNAADEAFYSLEPAEYAPGKKLDISKELLPTHASAPIGRFLGRPDVTDEELLAYAHHIDHGIRSGTVGKIVAFGRYHLIVPLLKSPDPRVRRAGLQALTGYFKARALPDEARTDEMIELAAAMVEDPDEAWWVVEAALKVLGMGRPEQIAPHVERLEYWLQHDEWWLRSAALRAVTPIVADKRYYKRLLPIVGNMIANNARAAALGPVPALLRQVERADPEVQQLAAKTVGRAYVQFPDDIDTPGGRDMSAPVDYLLTHIARYLAEVPGGFDELYRVAKKRFPDEALPHLDVYMKADPSEFGPVVKDVFEPLMREQLIWQYVGNHLSKLDQAVRSHAPNRELDGLVDLYQKIGVADYDWRLWGPARDKIAWDYITYDPPEQKLWERHKSRYRPVSWPAGAEDWMKPTFNASAASWQTGFAPFAHLDGKLAPIGGCTGPHHFCGCGNPPNTFWEKEVLLMRSELKLPPMREGYAYRFLVGGRSHVGSGDGSDVWFNGERIPARRKTDPTLSGVGKRQGGKPWGVTVEGDFRRHFTGDKLVTVAATGFLPIHKTGVKRNYQAFWFEQMKLPKLGEKEILRALKATPLRTAAWQASGDDKDKYQFAGFDDNDEVLGVWTQVGVIESIEDFDPDARLRIEGRWPRALEFKPQGQTGQRLMYYSGDKLLNLSRTEALTMTIKEIEGAEYLFIEEGGFRDGKMDATVRLYVMKRK